MREILLKRNIEYLMHFTRVENLQSILRNGLYPREDLDENGCIFNDTYRYDRCENAVCTSIEFPNYKMFYSLRSANPDTRWVVLAIDSQILLDVSCAFCETNAGSQDMYQIPLGKRMGKLALEQLFKDDSFGHKRGELDIPDCYPTNPQAEVLVFGKIPTEYIKYVFFNDRTLLQEYDFPPGIKGVVDTDYFYGRRDYKKWQ